MEIEPKLKPLYANLKRLKIGDYLYTKEFKLLAIENDLDEDWDFCLKEVSQLHNIVFSEHLDSEDREKALIFLMTIWYDEGYEYFMGYVAMLLLSFAEWHSTKLDFNSLHDKLKQLGVNEHDLLQFTKKNRIIRDSKPEKIEECIFETNEIPKIKVNPKKVFVVHGHDDKARLELCNILKDDLGMEPVVLQQESNVSIETIITKFERLAADCSTALILFTPDDSSEGKFRARQNVILELGYFLGKFQGQKNRRIAIIKRGDIEIPSDISGVLYLEYHKNMKEIFYDLQKQFEAWEN
ncbi:TIR domain-containing protein [Ancylomarina sp. YFZ004]